MKTLSFLAAALLLASCANPPAIKGEFISKDGRIKVHPNGRIELALEPRTAK
jgi:uncharacterized lipoprotein YajG